MKISVKFVAYIKELTDGVQKLVVDLPDESTLNTLIDYLSQRFPKFAKKIYIPKAPKINPEIQILINGRSARLLKGVNAPLKDTDAVVFLPPVGGGII
ncbi:MAG: MoaD/ThiS family protein [Candidatus Ranarchaeia archaeon]|jgi:molybdopterin synthase sulfur carrier subunit